MKKPLLPILLLGLYLIVEMAYDVGCQRQWASDLKYHRQVVDRQNRLWDSLHKGNVKEAERIENEPFPTNTLLGF